MKRHAHTYEELARVGQRYYNDTNFCGVIAVAAAAQLAFGKARALLKKRGRPDRQGTPLLAIEGALMAAGCSWEYQTDLTLIHGHTIGAIERARLPGVYMVLVRGHILTIIDGVVMDWTAGGRRHRVKRIWKISRDYV